MAVYGPVRHQKNIIWTEASDHMTRMKLPVTSRLKTCDFRLRLKSVLLSDIISLRLQDTYIYQS